MIKGFPANETAFSEFSDPNKFINGIPIHKPRIFIPPAQTTIFTDLAEFQADGGTNYWKFDETSGSNAADACNSLNLSAGPTTPVIVDSFAANLSKARLWSLGSDTFLSSSYFTTATKMILGFAFKKTINSSNQRLLMIMNQNDNTQAFMVELITPGYLYISLYIAPVYQTWRSESQLLTLNTNLWLIIEFTAKSGGEQYCYLNGGDRTILTNIYNAGTMGNGILTRTLHLGKHPNSTDGTFQGILDEIFIIKEKNISELNKTDLIAQFYNSGNGKQLF